MFGSWGLWRLRRAELGLELELSELGDDEAVGLFLRSLFIEPWTGG
jgi:hypothetical protein